MHRLQKVFLLVLIAGIFFMVHTNKVEAARVVGDINVSPDGARALCTAGTPVDFTAYPSDVDFDVASGTATYNINVQWSRCNSSDTRAYAVYEASGANSDRICPKSGTYGPGDVYDCVKYIGSPAYSGSSSLTCPGGTNSQCVTGVFSGVRKTANQPTFAATGEKIPRSVTRPGWSTAPANGTWTITGRMCQFYKIGTNSETVNTTEASKRCVNIRIDISWLTESNNSQCQPFPGGVGLPKAEAPENIALRTVDGQPVSNKQVVPGQELLLGVSFINTGTTTWQPNLGVYALANTGPPDVEISSAPPPYNTWQVKNDANNPPKLVYAQNGSSLVPKGKTMNFWFKVKLPLTIPNNQITLSWRMRQTANYESRGPATFGPTCQIKLASPENLPFIRAAGNDVVSGATFGLGLAGEPKDSGSCSTTRTSNNHAKDADIETNGYQQEALYTFNGFSSSQYATFASGEIGSDDYPNNYAGNNATTISDASTTLKSLLFANQKIPSTSGDYGHFYGTHPGLIPCIDTKDIQNRVVDGGGNDFQGLLGNAATFLKVNGHLDVSGTVNTQKVLFVEGDVTIKGSVTYDPGSYGYDANGSPKPPYLMIIATQGIQIEAGATTLDGHYVSLPVTNQDEDSTNVNSGRLDTCSNAAGATSQNWLSPGSGLTVGSCNQKLTINGSIIARRILWKRTYGTIGTTANALDSTPKCVVNSVTFPSNSTATDVLIGRLQLCSSELIEFSPEAYFGPFGSGTTGASSVPLSTQELPPIY